MSYSEHMFLEGALHLRCHSTIFAKEMKALLSLFSYSCSSLVHFILVRDQVLGPPNLGSTILPFG